MCKKTVLVKAIDDKRQITATFSISMSGVFLPIRMIYGDKTIRCLANMTSLQHLMLPSRKYIGQSEKRSEKRSEKPNRYVGKTYRK